MFWKVIDALRSLPLGNRKTQKRERERVEAPIDHLRDEPGASVHTTINGRGKISRLKSRSGG